VFRNGRGETFFGRNFDWKHNACLILRIHRDGGVTSVAVIDLAYLNLDRPDLDELGFIHRIPLLFAPYYVMDGVNQHGVAIADMALRGSKAPYDEAKPDVIHSTAMRLVLDEAETTQQALEILRRYNIHFVEVGCHYMIADAGGHSAVVEFIDGEMKVTDTAQDWRVCTNHRIWGKSEAQNDAFCGRYQHASEQLASMSPAADMDDVMRIMESVSKNDWTMWTSVYNLSTGEFQVVHRKSARPGEHRGRLSDGQ
jgi:predicted choloylglycine hydrolase